MKITKQNTKQYKWGDKSNGWYFLESPHLHIIEALMLPNAAETKYYHNTSEQFFYIIKGIATFEIGNEIHKIQAREAIYILPEVKHQIKNLTNKNLEFIVISQPAILNYRINKPFENNIGESQIINLNNKQFKGLSNSKNGEVSDETIFTYHQKNDIIWATYEGGDIKFGTLSGSIIDNQLKFNYQHQNLQGTFLTGKCETVIFLINNKIQLHENWQWTCRDFSCGESVLVEVNFSADF